MRTWIAAGVVVVATLAFLIGWIDGLAAEIALLREHACQAGIQKDVRLDIIRIEMRALHGLPPAEGALTVPREHSFAIAEAVKDGHELAPDSLML